MACGEVVRSDSFTDPSLTVRRNVAQSKKKSRVVAWGGFDLSTTGLGLGVRSAGGDEAYVHTKMRGATTWSGQPAFALEETPRMILTLLDDLEQEGWVFAKAAFSFAVRQHDMVLLDGDGQLLIPALSWQCNAASSEVQQLRKQHAEETVGRVEERFILPKLMWALRTQPSLRKSISEVMTTGDWIAALLTGKPRLSMSDALSNGLLVQKTKRLSADVMRKAKLSPEWFPRVVPSGKVVGTVSVRPVAGADQQWMLLKQRLAGSQVISGLGDNHATGVGCGLEEGDFETIVVSAGTSGTVNRVCRANVRLAGNAACFEYYNDRLLLMMLADCCKWYDRFVACHAPQYVDRLGELNDEIEQCRFEWTTTRVAQRWQGDLSAGVGPFDSRAAGGEHAALHHAGVAVAGACDAGRSGRLQEAGDAVRVDGWVEPIAVLPAGILCRHGVA